VPKEKTSRNPEQATALGKRMIAFEWYSSVVFEMISKE
jgi:hypothetical protein